MYTGTIKKSARSEAYSNLQTLRLLEEQYFAENGCYYKDTSDSTCKTKTTDETVADIQTFLPGFQPGNKLNFKYKIAVGANGATFTATATGTAGSRVAGETYTINNQNVRTNW